MDRPPIDHAKWAKFQIAKKAIIAKHGLSTPEWRALDAVRLKVPYAPAELAEYCVWLAEPFPDASYSAADYARAMDTLVARGFLHVLTVEDVAGPPPPHSVWDEELFVGLDGKLDFTPAGYSFMEEVSAAFEKSCGRPLLRKKPPSSAAGTDNAE